MEFDNPAASGQWEGHHHANTDNEENTDFSEKEDNKKNKKEKTLLGSAKKKDKDKKKETRYAQLGDDSSGEEEGDAKKTKKKAFKFGSAKKEKKEKRDKESKEKDRDSKDVKEEKKKDKKDKPKLKLKKSKHTDSESENKGKGDEGSIFGVPLELAVERNKCHDGIILPVIVRECIDYIEEHGLSTEGIYRSSGVKSKVNKLKAAYNSSQSVNLYGTEPSVVASLLKLFLRELPDPVLTHKLLPSFEEVSAMKQTQKRVEGMKNLLQKLPDCNRVLIQWIFVHMVHVIGKEKHNKMTLQNVSIVLSPTMQISHRVLNCFFENSHAMFAGVTLKKYVPPISGVGGVVAGQLPESPDGIEEEMRKQESLLSDLHLEISRGSATRAKEEQLWEQQRIVTQLKRKLRMAQKEGLGQGKQTKAKEPIDYEEKLDFTLQIPVVKKKDEDIGETTKDAVKPIPASDHSQPSVADKVVEKQVNEEKAATVSQLENIQEMETSKAIPVPVATKPDATVKKESKPQSDGSSPDSKNDESDSLEHKVTVQIHRDAEHGQVQPTADEDNKKANIEDTNTNIDEDVGGKVCVVNDEPEKKSGEERGRRVSHVTVIKLGPDQPSAPQEEVQVRFVTGSESFKAPVPVVSEAFKTPESFKAPVVAEAFKSAAEKKVLLGNEENEVSVGKEAFKSSKGGEEFPASTGSDSFKIPAAAPIANEVSKIPKGSDASKPPSGNDVFKVPAPPKHSNKSAFPLLPPPPPSNKISTRNILKPVILPSGRTKHGNLAPPVRAGHDNRLKSKSLPRGLPSDGSVFEQWSDSSPDREDGKPLAAVEDSQGDGKKKEEENLEALKWEEMRLKFEYEELLNLKSELERRKRTERREIQELQEEIATMQTLYQYRTYSVDSSDSSDGEERGGGINQLPQLQEQQKALEGRKLALAAQLKEERDACVRLRVHIRLEQERIKRKNINTA